MIRLVLLSVLVFTSVQAHASQLTQCWNADHSTKISILFRDSGSDRGTRADALELSRHDAQGFTVVERFTTNDGSLNNSDDFIVAYVADRPELAQELGVDSLAALTVDIASTNNFDGVRAAQVVFTNAAGTQVGENFSCSSRSQASR
jgi:hypothetical protein